MTESFLDIADALVNEYLLKTESLFVSNRQTWVAHFAEHFLSTCESIQKMQAESDLMSVSYLEYTMLYTNFASRKYLAEIRVYGEESPKGIRSIIIHLAVAESMLRRNIIGLKLTRILQYA